MEHFDQAQLFQRYETLPEALKDAIFSETSAERIGAIGKKHELLIDATVILASEIGYFMLGLSHPKEFVGRISETLGIPIEKARAIADDVNRDIFQPVRNDLKKLYGVEENVPAPATPPPPPQQQSQRERSFVAPMVTRPQQPAEAKKPTPPPAPRFQIEPAPRHQELDQKNMNDPYHETVG